MRHVFVIKKKLYDFTFEKRLVDQWNNNLLTFTAHLNVTIKCLTRYKQKVVLFGHHVGGQEYMYAIQRGGQYKSYYFVGKIKVP